MIGTPRSTTSGCGMRYREYPPTVLSPIQLDDSCLPGPCSFEWRRSTEIEKAALLGHFSLMGDRMGIKGVREWKSWDDANAFQEAYEVLYYR